MNCEDEPYLGQTLVWDGDNGGTLTIVGFTSESGRNQADCNTCHVDDAYCAARGEYYCPELVRTRVHGASLPASNGPLGDTLTSSSVLFTGCVSDCEACTGRVYNPRSSGMGSSGMSSMSGMGSSSRSCASCDSPLGFADSTGPSTCLLTAPSAKSSKTSVGKLQMPKSGSASTSTSPTIVAAALAGVLVVVVGVFVAHRRLALASAQGSDSTNDVDYVDGMFSDGSPSTHYYPPASTIVQPPSYAI